MEAARVRPSMVAMETARETSNHGTSKGYISGLVWSSMVTMETAYWPVTMVAARATKYMQRV